jgi:hypothetical protein
LTNLKKRKFGKPGCKKEDDIDKDLNRIEKYSLKWINLAQDRNISLLNTARKYFLGFIKYGEVAG